MSIFLRLEQKNFKTRETAGKWYAKATPLMTAHTEDLAKSISDSATFTKADVEGVIGRRNQQLGRRIVRNFLENVKWTWSPQWKEIRKK